jgi:hypothetical protein
MVAYVFQQLASKGAKAGIQKLSQKESMAWYREEAQKITNVNNNRLMTDKENVTPVVRTRDIGKMFMFFYDPKLKKILPYYDKFPMIILVNVDADGFTGLNLHYLPPKLRAQLMDALYTLRNNNKYDDSTKLQISYEILTGASKFRYFAPCFKRYLYGHVQSNFLYVSPENWDKALMLPTERFAKASTATVYAESQAMVRR